MIVFELLHHVDLQRLIRVHSDRNGGKPTIDVLAWVRILMKTKPSDTSDYALLGVTCGDGICRAMVVDMLYISALAQQQPVGPYPRTVDLGQTLWSDILAMEVCQDNVTDVGCEELVDEIIRWVVHENSMPLPGDELTEEDKAESKEVFAELRHNMEKALRQHIFEHDYG